jgi:gliding motility-associated-like protein
MLLNRSILKIRFYLFISSFLLFLFIFFSSSIQSQNIVPNGSFETLDTCPYGAGFIYHANSWFQPVFYNGTNSFGASSSDLFNVCTLGLICDVPLNGIGYQNPKSGVGYAGIIFGIFDSTFSSNLNYREYIEVKLNSKLKPDTKYCLSYYVSLANYTKFATSRIGAYFSKDSLVQRDTNFYKLYKPFNLIPQVENPYGNIITDTANWVLVRGEFIAQGGEQFLTIGNFYDNPQSDSLTVLSSLFVENAAYYYIDDVSLIEVKQALAGKDTSLCKGDSVCIGANDSTVMCTWFPTSGLSDSTTSQPKAAPLKSTTYYVSITDSCGYTSTDSVRITVLACDSAISDSSFINFPNIFSPNNDGINDVFVSKSKNIVTYNCKVYNRYGIRVAELKQLNEAWDGYSISGEALPAGVYYYLAEAIGQDDKVFRLKGFVSLVR